jgi:hypothetical protein
MGLIGPLLFLYDIFRKLVRCGDGGVLGFGRIYRFECRMSQRELTCDEGWGFRFRLDLDLNLKVKLNLDC